MSFVFVSQRCLDQWLDAGAAAVAGDRLTLRGQDGVVWRIEPSVYVVSYDSTAPGGDELVGRVKTSGELDRLGAEHFGTAVVIGDFAFTVKPGYLARPETAGGLPQAFDGALQASLAGLAEAFGPG